jgi:hypothetical protein
MGIVVAGLVTNLQVRVGVGPTVGHTLQVMNINRLTVEQVLTAHRALPLLSAANLQLGPIRIVADGAALPVPCRPVGAQGGVVFWRPVPHENVAEDGGRGHINQSFDHGFAAP